MCMKKSMAIRRKVENGYLLIETLVSILLFSLGLLGLVGIQANSIRSVTEARLRSDAVLAANELVGRMWVDRTNLASYAGTTTVAGLPAGQRVVAVDNQVVTVTVTWRTPGTSADHSHVTTATLGAN
jgi:type IV pilus assembly protein PilV